MSTELFSDHKGSHFCRNTKHLMTFFFVKDKKIHKKIAMAEG